MIAADSSSLIAFLGADDGQDDLEQIDAALATQQLILPPIVVAELCSSPYLLPDAARLLNQLPHLSFLDGYWERAGRLRAIVREQGLKAALADVLIAQLCIDHDVALITRDHDFRHYVKLGGLRLA